MQTQTNYKSIGILSVSVSAILIFSFCFVSCKKLISIPPPTNSITTSQVFSRDDQATSAAAGMYIGMININPGFASGGVTFVGGASADELTVFDQSTYSAYFPFEQNTLLSSNSTVGGTLWTPAYSVIYSANAVLSGLDNNDQVHDSVKNELVGEALFVRAFCNFYLVNLFRDIPLVTTTNWHNTNLLARSSVTDVYKSILSDLLDAQNRLPDNYSVGNGNRIIPNKWAATALLARVYLYTGDWQNAINQSTAVIDNSALFNLETDLNKVFLSESTEAIWQLQPNSNGITFNATPEGFYFVPSGPDIYPNFYLTTQLLNAFEPNDKRRISWIDTVSYQGIDYHIPYKYKIGPGQTTPGGTVSEYYMVFRLAEQYLIRAEARAQKNNLMDASLDLNMIRERAGLSDTTSGDQTQLLSLIAQERRIEFFAEWGHRWLDLKRTNMATTVLAPIKPGWTENSKLYPIPYPELALDPNLIQNPGY